MERHDFRLHFVTDRNEIARINVPRANPDATGDEVSNAMENIINSEAVQTNRGEPIESHSAELVTTTRTEFDVAG